MSDVRTALNGAKAQGVIRVADAGPRGMITIRGLVAERAAATLGLDTPDVRRIVFGHATALAWMSPDEFMVFCPYETAPAQVAALSAALGDAHALVADVSDARAVIDLTGPAIRDVLSKLSPVDFAPAAFGVGEMRRTRLAQVPAAIWFSADEVAHVVCFRSVAGYAFDVLKEASAVDARVSQFPGN